MPAVTTLSYKLNTSIGGIFGFGSTIDDVGDATDSNVVVADGIGSFGCSGSDGTFWADFGFLRLDCSRLCCIGLVNDDMGDDFVNCRAL